MRREALINFGGIYFTFLALLTLATAAPPTSGVQKADNDMVPGVDTPIFLDSSNFDQTIAKDRWWVKFFSPYCAHCIAMKPAWNEVFVAKKEQYEAEGFHFASVDCAAQFDLCDTMKVTGYPSLFLFEDGKFVKNMENGKKTVETLTAFAEKHLKPGQLAIVEAAKAKEEKDKAAADVIEKNDADVESAVSSIGSPVTQSEASVATLSVGSATSTTIEITATAEVSDTQVSAVEALPSGSSTEMTNQNPNGVSVNIDQAKFKEIITNENEGWVIKFFSPKCHHCVQFAPTWTQVAKTFKNSLNVGEVNCDKERQLCQSAGIDAYPSVKYISGDMTASYVKKQRSLTDLVSFATGADQARVIVNVDEKWLNKYTHDKTTPQFVYFYDENTVKEDFIALQRFAVSMIGKGRVFKTSDKKLIAKANAKNFPALYAVLGEQWLKYGGSTPREIRETSKLTAWAQDMYYASVPELTPSNYDELLKNSPRLVIGIVDPQSPATKAKAISELRDLAIDSLKDVYSTAQQELRMERAAKQAAIDDAVEKDDVDAEDKATKKKLSVDLKRGYGFAWIDGVYYKDWVKEHYGSKEDSKDSFIPGVVIQEGTKFWDKHADGTLIEITKPSISTSLRSLSLSTNNLKHKFVGSSYVSFVLMSLKEAVNSFWKLLLLAIVIAVLLVVYRRKRFPVSPVSRYIKLEDIDKND